MGLLSVALATICACTAVTGANQLTKTDECFCDAGADTTDAFEAPPSCNERAPTAWSAPKKLDALTAPGTSSAPVDPYVLPDGLTLFFTAVDATSTHSRIFFASRAGRADPFAAGTPLAGLETLGDKDLKEPALENLRELIFASEGDLWVATRPSPADAVKPTKYPPGDLNTPDAEGAPTVSAHGELRMVFVRTKTGERSRLFEARRSDPSPGGAWSDVTDLTLLNGAGYDLTCPALSPDGLTLFYASNSGEPAGTSIYVARRPKLDATFNPPEVVKALSVTGKTSCPRAITDDGCEIYLTNDSSGARASYVAARGP